MYRTWRSVPIKDSPGPKKSTAGSTTPRGVKVQGGNAVFIAHELVSTQQRFHGFVRFIIYRTEYYIVIIFMKSKQIWDSSGSVEGRHWCIIGREMIAPIAKCAP